MLFQENVEFQAIWDSFWCLLDSMLIQAHSQPSTTGSWLKCKAGNYKCACPRQKKFASLPVATLGHKTLNCMFSCSRQQFSNFLNSCLVLWYWFHCENCLQVGLNFANVEVTKFMGWLEINTAQYTTQCSRLWVHILQYYFIMKYINQSVSMYLYWQMLHHCGVSLSKHMHPQMVLKPLIYSRFIQAKLFIYSIAIIL